MDYIRLTRRFTFEMAHALHNYDGACRNIHGHSYKLEVTILGTPISDEDNPKNGMVLDFGDLKKLVQEHIISPLDHALLLHENTAPELIVALRKLNHKLVLTSWQPTCERMLLDFKNKLLPALPPHITLHSIRLWETENSHAEWFAADNA